MSILPQLIMNSLIAGSLYALVAMSFNLIYGVSRSFNLAHGALGTVGAYGVFVLAGAVHLPLSIAILLSIAAAALSGWLLECTIFRPLRGRKSSNLVLLIASLGASVAIEALIAIFFSSQFRSLANLIPGEQIFHIGPAAVTEVQLLLFFTAIAVLIGFWLLLSYTVFGKALRAIADDEDVAKIVGIDTARMIGWAFILGSAVMGLTGILAGFDTGLEPRMGFLLLLGGAIAAIIGGIGNVYGAFLGAFLLGFIENFGVWFVSGEWKYAISFSVLILFLLFRPQGFFGRKP